MDRYDEMCAAAECELCDDHGIRPDNTRCDHVDYAAIAKRGLEKVREALKRG